MNEAIPEGEHQEARKEEVVLDRVIRAVKTLSFLTVIYFLAFFRFSIAWIYLGAIIYFLSKKWEEEGKRKWDIARAMAVGYEKDFLVTRLQHLPSWVNFPDIERSEWLNKIIRQTWLRVNHYTKDLVSTMIEPQIQKYIKGFKFTKVVLGNVPFRIDGIKVYGEEDVSRDKIVMDVDITYAGDCRITFQVSGVSGGIENFMLRGRLRIVMKPLISKIPIIGGLQVYFLSEPEIDFDLKGVTQVLSIPGLRNIVENSVIDTINSMLLYPNIFPIQLSSEVPLSKISIVEPDGVLRVHVIEAKHLMKKDVGLMGSGKSDPYAVLSIGPKTEKTKIIKNTVDPNWDEWFEFEVEANSELKIHLWDWDEGSKDDSLGTAKVNVGSIVKSGDEDQWLPLDGAMHGMVRVRLIWNTLSSDPSDLNQALKETQLLNPKLTSALLTLYIDSANNLPEVKPLVPPDSYIVVELERQMIETDIVKHTKNPVYEKNLIFKLINPKTASMVLRIFDKKSETEIGVVSYSTATLIDQHQMQIVNHPFVLRKTGAESSAIICTMKLRAYKNEVKKQQTNSESSSNCEDVSASPEAKNILTKQDSTASTVSSVKTGGIKSQDSFDQFEQEIDELEIESSSSEIDQELEDPPIAEAVHGSIQLTMRYSPLSSTLNVVVHQVRNLPQKSQTDIPDPYVKLYLLPERAKESKRKTRVIKDDCNPVFDETFHFSGVSPQELSSSQLEVTVMTQKKGLFGNTTLGQVVLPLKLDQTQNKWYDLKHQT